MNSDNICFIDFETSGIDVFRDAPLQFGAVLINSDFKIINTYNTYINNEKKIRINKSAFKIHDIVSDSLVNAPTQKEVLEDFFDKFGTNFRFGGWNINFDVSFFRRMCNQNGMMVTYKKINHRHIDVQSLNFLANELGLFPQKLNSLSDIANFFEFKRSTKHIAYEYALLTSKVFETLFNFYKMKIKK